MRSSTFLVALLLVSATSGPSMATQAPGCSPKESVRQESMVASIKDWRELYSSFNADHSCTGEAFVEVWSAYSETVARLLAEQWNDLDKLSKLTTAHPGFKRFVIKHLSDETIPESTLSKVREHAQHERASGMEQLCKELAAATK